MNIQPPPPLTKNGLKNINLLHDHEDKLKSFKGQPFYYLRNLEIVN